MKTFLERFYEGIKVDPETGCWIWTKYIGENGYGYVGVGNQHIETTHRVSWEIHNALPIPNGLWVLHRCDNRPCANPEHLFIGDCGANARDMAAKGRNYVNVMYGEKHPNHKLTVKNVIAIRKDQRIYKEIAKDCGVCTNTILKVRNYRLWGHIPDPPTEMETSAYAGKL